MVTDIWALENTASSMVTDIWALENTASSMVTDIWDVLRKREEQSFAGQDGSAIHRLAEAGG